MASRFYRPKRDDHVTDAREVLIDHAHDIAVNQLIPRIARQNQIAVETISLPLYFYSKIRSGRRCSCFDLEVSANSQCRCCFGTGVVGGYEKYGTDLEVFDVTHPSIRAQNVIPDYSRRDRPRHFVLVDGALFGHVTTRMYVNTNIGEIDHIFVLSDAPSGTWLEALIKAPTDSDYVEFTTTNFESRLFNPWIDLRITLRRSALSSPSPRFGLLYIRYRRMQVADTIIKVNKPRVEKSDALGDFGVADDWTPQTFWTTNKLRSITTEDFFAQTDGAVRYRINLTKDMAPEGKLVSWDLDVQLLQPYQSQAFVPL